MSFYFENGEFINEGLSWLVSLLIAIAGAFVGGFFAVGIFYYDVRRRHREERTSEDNERRDRLIYLSAVMESIIELVKERDKSLKKFYKALIKQYINQTFEFDLIELHANNNLYRIAFILDPDNYFHSYLRRFESSVNRGTLVLEFQKLFKNCDFLYHSFEGFTKHAESFQKDTLERRYKYRELISKFIDDSALYVGSNHDQLSSFLNLIIFNYRTWINKHQGDVPMIGFERKFSGVVKFALVTKFRNHPYSPRLLITLKSATQLMFTDIQKNYRYYLEESQRDMDDHHDGVEKLIKNSKRLLETFHIQEAEEGL